MGAGCRPYVAGKNYRYLVVSRCNGVRAHTISATLCDIDSLSQPSCNQIYLVAYVQCGKSGMWTICMIASAWESSSVSVHVNLVKCAAGIYNITLVLMKACLAHNLRLP